MASVAQFLTVLMWILITVFFAFLSVNFFWYGSPVWGVVCALNVVTGFIGYVLARRGDI
jgi:hypothetical protein